MTKRADTTSYPNRKISETLLALAAPLLEAAGVRATKGQIEKVLQIAFSVWNSVVYDTINSNSHYVDRLRELAAKDAESSKLIEEMITRKNTMFSDDHRLIGEYKLRRKLGGCNLGLKHENQNVLYRQRDGEQDAGEGPGYCRRFARGILLRSPRIV